VTIRLTASSRDLNLQAKYRRENRGGYETQEGLSFVFVFVFTIYSSRFHTDHNVSIWIDHWEDPAGYFEHLVWPAYIGQHKHLFVNEDATEGLLTEEAKKDNLVTQADMDMTLEDSMRWAVDIVMKSLATS